MNRVAAVLFDLDGTLLDSAPDLVAALNWVRQQENLTALPVEEMSRHASRGAAGLLAAGMPAAGPERLEEWKAGFLQRYAEHHFVHTRLYPGIQELLDYLAGSSIPWGIVTNKVEALTLPVLQAAGLLDTAGCVVCGDTCSRSKPDPAPVELACRLLRVAPRHTLFVGDDIRDLQAGKSAGTQVAAVHYGYGSDEFTDDHLAGSLSVHHPADLVSWLNAQP